METDSEKIVGLDYFLNKIVNIRLKSGTFIIGELVGFDEDFIFTKNLDGATQGIPKPDIANIALKKGEN
jgi:hypothetical protein